MYRPVCFVCTVTGVRMRTKLMSVQAPGRVLPSCQKSQNTHTLTKIWKLSFLLVAISQKAMSKVYISPGLYDYNQSEETEFPDVR